MLIWFLKFSRKVLKLTEGIECQSMTFQIGVISDYGRMFVDRVGEWGPNFRLFCEWHKWMSPYFFAI